MELEQFGTFRSTFQLTTFVLIISMMYPRPGSVKRRLLGTFLMTLVVVPIFLIVLSDCYNSLMRKDLHTLIYHSTVVGPYLGGVIKVVASMYEPKLGDELIQEIDRDYSTLNSMPEQYKRAARNVIANCWKYCESYWLYVVLASVYVFPTVTMILNIKSAMHDDNPRQYMIHDVPIPFKDPEYRLETPAYELVFASMMYVAYLVTIYYVGYDAFFAISVNHACLKIDLFCLAFEDALKWRDKRERCRRLGFVVEEQLRLYRYVDNLQGYFSIYLGVILFAALIQIGSCLYHFQMSEEFEIQYVMMGFGTTCCIFFPCASAAELKYTSEQSAVRLYCGGWENVQCVTTRKIVLFMICRSQIPIEIKGFNWVPFDMDLFVSIMKSAYSIYTLLCS